MQKQWDSSWLDSGNQTYLDDQYEKFLANPNSLDKQWQDYFANLAPKVNTEVSHAKIREQFKNFNSKSQSSDTSDAALEKLAMAYRLLGHQNANTNPLEIRQQKKIPELEPSFYGLDSSAGADFKTIYCGTVATEFMHITDTTERLWVQENLERCLLNFNLSKQEKLRMLELVIASDGLEKYLGAKYPGAKRFSIEGCDTLLVALDRIINTSSSYSTQEIVIAMAHRGRLSVLVNLLGKKPRELFDQFEEKHSMQVESGDVKYHQGFASDLKTPDGNIHVSLAFNPSHLEIVTPVAVGSVRARQERRKDVDLNQVMCVAIHGDAAFAGQGIVMEILNMSQTRGFHTGGTVHIIINNQIGFTTSNPHDARSTLYCSDIGKMLAIPIFHVNADDPEAMYVIAKIALEYKLKFHKDVIINLVGYRRMGHNEADEPSATQPVMYKNIRAHPTVKDIYAAKLISQNLCTIEEVEQKTIAYRADLDQMDHSVVKNLADRNWRNHVASDWSPYVVRDWRIPTSTKLPLAILKQLADARDKVPDGFAMNPRVNKIVEERRKMTTGELPIDWGYAETLAYASLVNEKYGVRLSGQDSGRGTFFHRHAVWHEQNTGETYVSLSNLTPDQASFTVIDSLLSEAGVLGFEYGFSSSEPRTLTLWEAQFGDFANGAQVVIDQFISSGEQKWGRLSGLVMLLPHGYEGQGPEHSSARIERYLQLCAQHNIQVCIPSTPAQIYHLLRRQMLRPMRKPLIIITPKSLLRHKAAVSSLDELANGEFMPLIPDNNTNKSNITRIVICSGKVYYDVYAAREKLKENNIAIIRLEQLYPFPEEELAQELSKYTNCKDVIWCQEEPKNQGAWYSTQHHLLSSLSKQQSLAYAGRGDSAAPAVGYFKLHEEQQELLVKEAIGE